MIIKSIALFRAIKALLLILGGFGALKLLHPGTALRVRNVILSLPFTREHDMVRAALARFFSLRGERLELLAVVLFAYAALFATEAVGLWMDKVWAEYLTLFATASFIPFEIYEVAKRVTALRIAVVIINVAIVIYLIVRRFPVAKKLRKLAR